MSDTPPTDEPAAAPPADDPPAAAADQPAEAAASAAPETTVANDPSAAGPASEAAEPAPATEQNSGPTDVQHEWVAQTLGVDPRSYLATGPLLQAAKLVAQVVTTAVSEVPVATVAAGAGVGLVGGGAVAVGGLVLGAALAIGVPYVIEHAKEVQEKPDPEEVHPEGGPPPSNESDGGAPDPPTDPNKADGNKAGDNPDEKPKEHPDDKPDDPTKKQEEKKWTCFDVELEQGIKSCEDFRQRWNSEAEFLRSNPRFNPRNSGGRKSSQGGNNKLGQHITYYDRSGTQMGTIMYIQCCEDLADGPKIWFGYVFA